MLQGCDATYPDEPETVSDSSIWTKLQLGVKFKKVVKKSIV